MTARPQRRFRDSIRFKLMLVSLSLLLIPWAGYRYLKENEQYLRDAQEEVLSGRAQAVAESLRNEGGLFVSGTTSSASFQDQYIYVHPLKNTIEVDGYSEDWSNYLGNAWRITKEPDIQFDAVIAQNTEYLYLLLQVRDESVIFRPPGGNNIQSHDYVALDLESPQGEAQRYLTSTLSPGWADVYRETENRLQPVSLIKSEWQRNKSGYTIEMRLPRYLVGNYLSIEIADVDKLGDEARRVSSKPAESTALNRLITVSPTIEEIIRRVEQKNTRIWVVDRFRRVLAKNGALQTDQFLEEEIATPGPLKLLFSLILPQPSEHFQDDYADRIQIQGPEIESAINGKTQTHRRTTPDDRAVILSTSWPITTPSGIVGAVLVEQTTNQILSSQNRAFESLFGLTLLLFITTSLLLLGFATLLTSRVHRLRNRVEEAVTQDGRILNTLTPDNSSDEIGDLSQSFASVLLRLNEYNRYLEAMASRLAHELRTPLAIVSSSLDNLSEEQNSEERKNYLKRANNGVERLTIILHRMREATRLEQLIQQSERSVINLADMLDILVQSYRSTFSDTQFSLNTDVTNKVTIKGSPELLSQALDKLITNAQDFHNKGTPIEIGLTQKSDQALITIANQGPLLPDGMEETIFDSMVSLRSSGSEPQSGDPHLGLGLYLVKLICAYHEGDVKAGNLSDHSGVQITIRIPLTH